MKAKAMMTRFGIADAALRVMRCRYRAQSHVALDRLHALDAEILRIERREDESIVALLDACVAYEKHDSYTLRMLSASVWDFCESLPRPTRARSVVRTRVTIE